MTTTNAIPTSKKLSMPETRRALESLRENAPEALDLSPRAPNPDGTPVINDEIVATKLEFIVQDFEEYISSFLLEHYAGLCCTLVFTDLDHPNPKRKIEMVEEKELFDKNFTPYWVWDMTEHKHVRIAPDDATVKDLDLSSFVEAKMSFDEEFIFVENRVMGPIPDVDQFLKEKREEDERAAKAAAAKP